MRTVLAAMLAVAAAPSPAAPAHRPTVSEVVASALVESRTCEVHPDNGGNHCHYRYRGLRFSLVSGGVLPDGRKAAPFVSIDSLEPGVVTAAILPNSDCFVVSVGSSEAHKVGSVLFNIKTGKVSPARPGLRCE